MIWIQTPGSSNVVRFGYDEVNRVLLVQFKNLSTYRYSNVPSQIFEQMKFAPSKGRFLKQHVERMYPDQRV